MAELLERIERYYDALPREMGGRAEAIGPLTLFVRDGPGWPLYARPSLGAPGVTSADIAPVERRMRELAVPQTFEWVLEMTPSMRTAALAAGYLVSDHPLLARTEAGGLPGVPAPDSAVVRRVEPDDDLPAMLAAAELSFATPGTAVARVGLAELADVARHPDAVLDVERSRLESGKSVRYAAWVDGVPVCTGLYTPVTGVARDRRCRHATGLPAPRARPCGHGGAAGGRGGPGR